MLKYANANPKAKQFKFGTNQLRAKCLTQFSEFDQRVDICCKSKTKNKEIFEIYACVFI